MTIAEAERFYKQDKKQYDLNSNNEFLVRLKEITNSGYSNFMEIEELQDLIQNITTWYEIKYPNRELEWYSGIYDMHFGKMERLSNSMHITQLLYRLPHNQLSLIEGGYRAKGWCCHNDSISITVGIESKKENVFGVKDRFSIFIDHCTGIVRPSTFNGYFLNKEELDLIDKCDISLEEMLEIFQEKYRDDFDFTELEECIYNHQCDIELRNRILQLTALNLLYSKNTIPEYGYERAKRFIGEFNKKLGLDLSTDEIDEIMNRDYTKEETYVSHSAEESETTKAFEEEDSDRYIMVGKIKVPKMHKPELPDNYQLPNYREIAKAQHPLAVDPIACHCFSTVSKPNNQKVKRKSIFDKFRVKPSKEQK